jgi:hypothetical protein
LLSCSASERGEANSPQQITKAGIRAQIVEAHDYLLEMGAFANPWLKASGPSTSTRSMRRCVVISRSTSIVLTSS